MMKKALQYSSIFLLLCLSVTSCGVKPDSVDSPPGEENTTFPRDYPDPETDPEPVPDKNYPPPL